MDPYLEGSAWDSFHAEFISELGRYLSPRLRPRYIARVERRFVPADAEDLSVAASDVYPDVSVIQRQTPPSRDAGNVLTLSPPVVLETVMSPLAPQRSLFIRDRDDRRLVAAIELLSPSNKHGEGREAYLERRRKYLESSAHLIEIDLLRRGTRVPMRGELPAADYFAFVSRANERPLTGVWPIHLREPLPSIPLPLLLEDADLTLPLQDVFNSTYDAFGYDADLDYRRPPQVGLRVEDEKWADALLKDLRARGMNR